MVGVPSCCAMLGGFAVGARLSLLWQHSAECDAITCTDNGQRVSDWQPNIPIVNQA